MRYNVLKKQIKWIISAVFILSVFFTTCDMPMGLGDPVDTVPPTVFIDNPQDNTKMKAITQGNPVVMEGTWTDDIGVTSMQFELIDKWHGNVPVKPSKINYKITRTGFSEGWVDGKWVAEIVIDASVVTEYRIRVYVLDKFGNKGLAEVNVQIDIIPPWIKGIQIARHPNMLAGSTRDYFVQDSQDYSPKDTGSTSGNRDSLPNRQYYINKGFDTNDADLWLEIKLEDLKEFQNESFRISTELISTFDNVAATKLNIYDEDGRLVTADGLNENSLSPDGYTVPEEPSLVHLRNPYWDITNEKLRTLRQSYNSGPHYISFEIRAWSKTDWDDVKKAPKIDPATGLPEPGRSQRAGGTMWFPESDNPHPYVDKEIYPFIGNNPRTITLTPNKAQALDVDFYDDDLLSEVYLGLVTKEAFDTARRNANPSFTEAQYLAYLAVDANSSARTAIMTACGASISSNPTSNLNATPTPPNITKRFTLNTTAEGEYRLIAIVKEGAKNTPGYTFTNTTAKWSVYPPLRVQVQTGMAPLIIVENPLRENAFPNLNSDGQTFEMKGYALSGSRTDRVLVGWVPPNTTPTTIQINGAFDAAIAAASWSGDYYTHTATGIKIWDATVTQDGKENFGATDYFKTNFTRRFDIIGEYFKVGANYSFKGTSDNLFVIKAVSDNIGTKTYRLSATSASPNITVSNPADNDSFHDRSKDLVFRMTVNPGTDGVKIDDSKNKISDNNPTNSGLSGTAFINGEWQASVPSSHIVGDIDKGGTNPGFSDNSSRNYTLYAENILGNSAQVPRKVTMSNAPLVTLVSCTNGSGTYAEGEELLFEVLFSMPVIVVGSPRLRLYFGTQGGTPSALADYVLPSTSTASNTLQFKYTVKLNDDSSLLKNSLNNNELIDINGATLRSYYGGDAVLTCASNVSMQETQTVKLDGVKPTIRRAYFTQIGTAPTYFTNGKTLTLNLECSETVMVSGAPKATIATFNTSTGALLRTFELEYSSKTKTADNQRDILLFTWQVSDGGTAITQETQLTWASPWITFGSGEDITDTVGNTIATTKTNRTIPTTALPANIGDRRGNSTTQPADANPTYNATNNPRGTNTSDGRAFILTQKPGTPSLTIYSAQTNAQSGGNTNLLSGTPLLTHADSAGFLYMRVTGIQAPNSANNYNEVSYSLTGGSNPNSGGALGGSGAERYSTASNGKIPDAKYADRILSIYTPSVYQLVVWQTDKAGNESDKATRDITINSRPADLTSVDISLQDGAHPAGTVVPFKLSFSQRITMNANSRVALTIAGRTANATGTATIAATAPVSTTASSLITINWTVPSTQATMKDIKVTSVTFTQMTDEYGNALTEYTGTAADNGSRRPIADNSSFQLNRPNLEIRSIRPRLVQTTTGAGATTSPAIPTTSGNGQNGGVLNNGATIRLVFAEGTSNVPANITAVAGKYITIRPYGSWAIPPVLTVEEFNSVYNFDFGTNRTDYRETLSNVDNNEIPISGSGRGSGKNLYRKNTQGVISGSGGFARPDTATKMILDFTTDLYDSANAVKLRTIFNAAGWKQQKILVTSSNVKITNNYIDITLPGGNLDKGRIWEILIDDGAFQDAARNASESVAAGDYRFWSAGTATPYVRADKVSYDARNFLDNGHTDLQFVTTAGVPNRPPVDTRVRIDCETPGANIRYNVIRTRYAFPADPFATTSTSDTTFFGANTGINTSGTAGNARNTIGNDDVTVAANKTNDFFNKLLVPITVDTGTATLTNGAIPYSTLTALVADMDGTAGGTNARQYQSVDVTTGARTFNNYTTGTYNYAFYVGELFGTTTNLPTTLMATSNTDARLWSGRRDYVVAVAKKNSVEGTGDNRKHSGPALDKSDGGLEGVYKTTLIYRDPRKGNNRAARVLVQGFDLPVMPLVAGFPLRDADSTASDNNAYNNYFSKSAWRYGTGTGNNSFTANYLNTNPTDEAGNNHIWVTWEIVTDWYQKGKGFDGTSGNYLDNGGRNANSIAATYGSVIYRYRQSFY